MTRNKKYKLTFSLGARSISKNKNNSHLIIHYSEAEKIFLRSAKRRHGDNFKCNELQWFDLYRDVFCRNKKSSNGAGSIGVKGAWGFGLKAVAKALYNQGAIKTSWPNSNIDGMAANVGTVWCHREAVRRNCTMNELEGGSTLSQLPANVTHFASNSAATMNNLMVEIEEYNEVDCKVMWEIVEFLKHH